MRAACAILLDLPRSNLSFTGVGRRGPVQVSALCGHHFYHGTNGLIHVVDSDDRDWVEEAKVELNIRLKEDEVRDAVVVVFANTLTPSTATRLGKLMTDVRKNGDLWLWKTGGVRRRQCCRGVKVHAPAHGVARGKAHKGRGKGKKAGGGGVPPSVK